MSSVAHRQAECAGIAYVKPWPPPLHLEGRRKSLVAGERAAAQYWVSFWSDEHSDVMVAQLCEHTKTSVLHTWCLGPSKPLTVYIF